MAIFLLPSCPFSFPLNPNEFHLRWDSHHYPLRKNFVFSCYVEKSSKRGKASKPTKSNEELCSDLRVFMSTMGLPENHVPSMKELSEHGRKDLANIVRRRGYKLITELLRNSTISDNYTEKPSTGDQDSSSACREAASDQEQNLVASTECIPLPNGSSLTEKCMARANGSISTDTCVQNYELSESSIMPLHSKTTNFTQSGELGRLGVANLGLHTDPGPDIMGSNSADTGYVASRQASLLTEQHPERVWATSKEGFNGADPDKDFTAEMASERDSQTEINRLRMILYQKEMELSEFKQQIEKEKEALCILQAKTSTEIGNVHRAIAEKDEELRAAEESLSGLKEVLIEYWGNGETVEVAGSFNGWHDRIKMDLHLPSKTINPPGSRNSKLWSTILWLYPGTYEIKFIVDGDWRVDSNREIITNGHVTNNVLRVDR